MPTAQLEAGTRLRIAKFFDTPTPLSLRATLELPWQYFQVSQRVLNRESLSLLPLALAFALLFITEFQGGNNAAGTAVCGR